jgi:hypothetical protein
METVRVLEMAFIFAKFEASANEEARDLNSEFFLAKLVLRPSEPVSVLNNKFCPARPEALVIETLRPWELSQPGVIRSLALETVVSVMVVEPVEPEYCHATQISTARKFPDQDPKLFSLMVYVRFVADVELAMFVEASQFDQRKLQVPRLFVPHCQAVTQNRATGNPLVEPTAPVRSICQVPDWMSLRPAWMLAVL